MRWGARLIPGLAVAVLAWAVLLAWLAPVRFLGNPDVATPLVTGSLAFAVIVIINGLRRWLKRWQPKTYWRVCVGLGVTIILMQLLVALTFVDVARADAFHVRNQAILLAQGHLTWSRYFLIYPNNVNFTLLEAGLLKLLRPLTATPWPLLNVLRFAWIDTALLSAIYLLTRWRRVRPGVFWLLLFWLLSPAIYAYGLFAYTDGLVLPVALNALAGLTYWAAHRQRWWVLSLMMLLVSVAVGFKTNLIVFWLALALIGIGLVALRRLTWRAALLWFTSLVVTLLLVMGGANVARQLAGYRGDANAQLPTTSWIAMSLNPRYAGQYNEPDFARVNDQPTAKAKQRQAQALIEHRLKQFGVSGLAVHLAKKMRVFWATGDFDSFKLTTQWLRAPRPYRLYQRNFQFWLVLMAQVGYLVLLLESCWTLLRAKTPALARQFIALTILGLTAFHVLFWEVEPRYALPLLPGLMLLTAVGLTDRPTWQWQPSRRRGGALALVGLGVLALISVWQTSQQSISRQTVVAEQGDGNYVEHTSLQLRPGQQTTVTINPLAASDQLTLSPLRGQRQRVHVRLTSDGRSLLDRQGRVDQLKKLTYPRTTGDLRVIIKNVGQQPVAYGAAIASYNLQTGRITPRPHPSLMVRVVQHHGPQTLSRSWIGALLIGSVFGTATLIGTRSERQK